MLTYSECRALMRTCRDKSAGKPIQNNTRLFERGSEETTYYVVRLHNTDIIEIYSNGTYGLRHDGWTTVTTRDRLYGLSPLTWQNLQSEGGNGGDWFLRVRADASDPEPPSNNHIQVVKPYPEPPRPGAEPQSEDFGPCQDGVRHSWTERESGLIRIDRLGSERGYRLDLYDITWSQIEDQPTPARRVLAYLAETLDESYVRMSYLQTFVVDYGERAWDHTYGRKSHHKYEQCPHCKAYQKAHREWMAAVNERGIWDANVEHYGSYDAWRSAWRDDRQAVIEANRAWRAWNERNRLPWDGLVIVNSDGYPLWSEVRAVRKAQAARRRAERAALRARREREKYERQLARQKQAWERKRKRTFEQTAAEVARELSHLNAKVTVSINDSSEE